MPSTEGFKQKHESDNALKRVPGLAETLRAWCDPLQSEAAPLKFDDVVKMVAEDEAIRDAARVYLRNDGYERDMEAARHYNEKLAWAIVDELARQSKAR